MFLATVPLSEWGKKLYFPLEDTDANKLFNIRNGENEPGHFVFFFCAASLKMTPNRQSSPAVAINALNIILIRL